MMDIQRLKRLKAERREQARVTSRQQITEKTTAYLLTTSWQRIEAADASRIGIELENHHATAVVWFATGAAPVLDDEARAVYPGVIRMIDNMAAQDAIFAKSDTASVYLTMTIKRGVSV